MTIRNRHFHHLAACFFILVPALLSAQQADLNITVDPQYFDGLQYRSAGPSRGGRATAIAGVPGQTHTFYFGATGGSIWNAIKT